MVVDRRCVLDSLIEVLHGLLGQFLSQSQNIRLPVTEKPIKIVREKCDGFCHKCRHLQQFCAESGAVVGRGEGSQRGYMLLHIKPGDHEPGIHAALGVGDEVYLFAVFFLQDLQNFRF